MPNNKILTAASSRDKSSMAIPVIVGLAAGIALVILFASFMTPIFSFTTTAAKSGPTTEKDFQRAERLQSVQLFGEKYPDFTSGFSQNSTAVTYHYNVSRWGDADGDGYKETFRRLSLSATFAGSTLDIGSGSMGEDASAASGLRHIEIKCDVASDDNRTLHNLVPPAHGEENVMDFLQHAKCII